MALYGSTHGENTAQAWDAYLQANYNITPRFYWYVGGRYDDDRCSGFAYQAALKSGVGKRETLAGARTAVSRAATTAPCRVASRALSPPRACRAASCPWRARAAIWRARSSSRARAARAYSRAAPPRR